MRPAAGQLAAPNNEDSGNASCGVVPLAKNSPRREAEPKWEPPRAPAAPLLSIKAPPGAPWGGSRGRNSSPRPLSTAPVASRSGSGALGAPDPKERRPPGLLFLLLPQPTDPKSEPPGFGVVWKAPLHPEFIPRAWPAQHPTGGTVPPAGLPAPPGGARGEHRPPPKPQTLPHTWGRHTSGVAAPSYSTVSPQGDA